MIAALTGILAHKGFDRVVVDVGGVGYLVNVSLQTLAELPPQGEKLSILCHTHVREDALQLFGFLQEQERQAFELLIGISGVGPKLALSILSGMPVGQLLVAIAESNHGRLQGIPGVGKKTAERLVMELKDRCAQLAMAQPVSARPEDPRGTEVVEALVGLGYKRPLAERAVQKVLKTEGAAPPPEQLLRHALSAIGELR
ncbi:MAG: Holliday junction branch migration protein RuvA [Deltaproteobacteria bacterium]|nr:Holliday junction branch migration protein RuvA [Deltaproteobacteria bacterium]